MPTYLEVLQSLHRIQQQLLLMEQRLNILTTIEERNNDMLDPTITAVIAQIDSATNGIATRIQKLIDTATKAGSVSAAEVTAALAPEVAKLQALAADPANPVPVVP